MLLVAVIYEYESFRDKDKLLSIKNFLDRIKPYLSDIINDHKTQGKWKIHLTMAINFIFSKDSEKTCTMHTKSDNIEFMIGNIMKSLKNFLILFYQNIKKGLKNQ